MGGYSRLVYLNITRYITTSVTHYALRTTQYNTMSSSTVPVDAMATAVEHCEQMGKDNPDLAEIYQSIAAQCQGKLWHQLTVTVLEDLLGGDPAKMIRTTSSGMHSFLALYNLVVLAVADKLNPLSMGRIAALVSQAVMATDLQASKALLENLLASYRKDAATSTATPAAVASRPVANATSLVAATIFVQSKLSLLTLQGLTADSEADKKELDAIKRIIATNAVTLAQLAADTAEQGVVHAAHYEQAMTFYKVTGPPEAFYEQAMSFLNYAPPGTDGVFTNYAVLAVDLCLAALTGDGVYNLGQVEQTPVLALLKDTPNAWLAELLHTTAAGDVTAFGLLTTKYAAQIQQQPALVHRAAAVQEKLTLLALVHMVFEKDSAERTLSIAEIAVRLQVATEQVEWVIMRAFSVHLMEGYMDQVSQTVTITWVLPRVLSVVQMTDLAARFGEWATKVSSTKEFMQEQTPTFA